MHKNIHVFLFFILLWGGLFNTVFGQKKAVTKSDSTSSYYTIVFRGTPIDEAIKELVTKTKLDLIYDPSLLRSQKVYSISKNESPEDILSGILKGTNLDYIRLSSGTYVIIESVKSEPRFGSIAGTVLDKETGKPLEGANILLADASTGTSTNRAGRFTLAPLLSGTYEVTITYVGYKPVRDTISIPGRTFNPQRFYLESRPVFVEPVVVSSIQRRLPYPTSDGEEIANLSNSPTSFAGSPDAIKSISPVMGINFGIPLADFSVQGGAEGEHRVILDGTPVYNPVSLGRLTGAFSPYALNKITVHKAGYRASIGSQLSGVVAIDQDLPAGSENNAVIQADPLNLNGRVNLSTDIGSTTVKTMMAARTNIWEWYQKPSLDNTLENWDRLDPLVAGNLLDSSSEIRNLSPVNHQSDINFYDLHLANEVTFNKFHSTYISFYRGKNYLQTRLLSEYPGNNESAYEAMYTQDTYDWLNTAVSAEHNWLVSPRLQASIGISYSRHKANHHFGMAGSDELQTVPQERAPLIDQLKGIIRNQPHTGDENAVTETSFEARFDYSLLQNHKLNLGIEPKFVNYSFRLSDLFYHFSTSDNSTFMLSGFLEDEFTLNYRTKVVGGSRFTYIPNHQMFFAEPRLSVQFDYPQTSIGFLSLKLAGGLYRQYINQFDLTNVGPSTIVPSIRFWVPVDYTTDVPKSWHSSTEVLVEPTETFTLRWEGFYKWSPTILAIDYHALLDEPIVPLAGFESQNSFIVHGKSYSLGTGFSANKFIESIMMELSASYQYSIAKQKIPKRFNEDFIRTPWNEPHKLMASVNWNIVSPLTASLRWQSIWGRSWAFNRSYYDYLTIDQNQTQFGPYSFDTPSDDKLSPYHQLDIGFSYSRSVGNTDVRLKLDLINVLNRKNTLENRLAPMPSVNGEEQYTLQKKSLPGFTPSLSLQFTY